MDQLPYWLALQSVPNQSECHLPHTTHSQISTTGSPMTQQFQHLLKHQKLLSLLYQPNSESSSNVVNAKGLESRLKITKLQVQSVPKQADAEVTLTALFITPKVPPTNPTQYYCYPLIPLLCLQMAKILATLLQN